MSGMISHLGETRRHTHTVKIMKETPQELNDTLKSGKLEERTVLRENRQLTGKLVTCRPSNNDRHDDLRPNKPNQGPRSARG